MVNRILKRGLLGPIVGGVLVFSVATLGCGSEGGSDIDAAVSSDGSVQVVGDAALVTVDSGPTASSCVTDVGVTVNATARTISGVSSITCNQAATLTVETCVQWDAGDGNTWEDMVCISSTSSNATQLQVPNMVRCGLSSNRQYRVRATATANGVRSQRTTVGGVPSGSPITGSVTCD